MNASDRPNTCKSRGIVAILETGARVRNAYVTCLTLGDSLPKGRLIPHNNIVLPGMIFKASVV